MSSPAPKIAHYLRFSLQCHIPIPVKFTVDIAQQFRAKAIWNFSKATGDHALSFALSGHDKPDTVEGEHQHAFYLPLGTDRGRAAFLKELHVWCAHGFTQTEIEALMKVYRLDWGGGKYPVRPVLITIGKDVPEDCQIMNGQMGRVWRSITPFVPPRYFYRGNLHGAKLKANDTPEQQLAQCLHLAGIDTPGKIRRLTPDDKVQQSVPPLADWDIVRTPEGEEEFMSGGIVTDVHVPAKPTKTEKTRRIGLFFEITFDAPVLFRVPALGHSSHFGLGLFAAVEDNSPKEL